MTGVFNYQTYYSLNGDLEISKLYQAPLGPLHVIRVITCGSKKHRIHPGNPGADGVEKCVFVLKSMCCKGNVEKCVLKNLLQSVF